MKYTIEWLENKAADWKVATLSNEAGQTIKEASINRTSKKGEVFPNFDALVTGGLVEGEFWISPSGKNYLFPPQPKKTYNSFAAKPNAIAGAMKAKQESITASQDKKEMAIMLSGSARDATLIVTTFYGSELSVAEVKKEWLMWREFFYKNHGDSESLPDYLK